MGKRGKSSRKRNRDSEVSPSTLASKILKKHHVHDRTTETPSDDEASEGLVHGISDEALTTTISTLQRLCGLSDSVSDKPAVKDKRYRDLRKVLYELQTSLGQTNVKPSGVSIGPTALTSTVSSSKITNDITVQIESGAWDKAVVTLRNLGRIQEIQRLMHQTAGDTGPESSIFQYKPKLGALQRWVRAIDAAGTDDPLALEVLDAMLRVVAPQSVVSVDEADLARSSWAKLGVGMGTDDQICVDSQWRRIRLFPAFSCAQPLDDEIGKNEVLNRLAKDDAVTDVFDKLVSYMTRGEDGIRYISDSNTVIRDECFRICGHEDGADRKPPNKYDLDLLTTSTIEEQQLLASNGDCKPVSSYNLLYERENGNIKVQKIPIPYVHGTFLLQNVLSSHECDRLIAAAELAKYNPDEPLAGQPGASILAHACVWIVDHYLERTIFDRVKKFLPTYTETKSSKHQDTNDNESDIETFHPLGVNRRFRFYRYIPGRYYRPHIDGAWPSSGFDTNGDYRYDVNDINNKNGMQFVQSEEASNGAESSSRPQLSRLTFLIYLNDDFDGGNTTFFIPSKEQEGVLNAFPVKPSRGCVLVFPHGTCEAPLHEGSPVLKGCKYVVRTEVEYYI